MLAAAPNGARCPHIRGDVSELRRRFCGPPAESAQTNGASSKKAKGGKSGKSKKVAAGDVCARCNVGAPDVWACVETGCGFRGCGRYKNAHILAHHGESRPGGTADLKRKGSLKGERDRAGSVAFHAVCVNTTTGVVWCYECDCEIESTPDVGDASASESSLPAATPALRGSAHARTASVGSSRSANGDTVDSGDMEDNMSVASSSVSSVSPRDNRRGVCGLANLGNTCYMNAALQALSHCHPLTQYFLDCQALVRHVAPGNHLVDSYAALLSTLWGGKFDSAVPSAVVREVRSLSPVFRGYGQQDSQEFLRFLLDKLGEGLKQPVVRPPAPAAVSEEVTNGAEGGDANGQRRPSVAAEKAPERNAYHSIVSDVFEGTLRSEVTCFRCGKTSIKDDAFLDLSVPIPSRKGRKTSIPSQGGDASPPESRDAGSSPKNEAKRPKNDASWFGSFGTWLGSHWSSSKAVTLEQCIGAFTATEVLTGDDRYRCEHCKAHTDSSKRFRILTLPEVLCVHVKRFRYDSYFSSKVSHRVTFPLRNFDMAAFVTRQQDEAQGARSEKRASVSESERPAEQENGEALYAHPRHKSMPKGTNYDLVAVINHRGGIGGGHYVCYAKNCVDSKWHEFDDSHVTEVDEDFVLGVEAYVLFYQRKPTEASQKEKKRIWRLIEEHANPAPSSSSSPTPAASGERYHVSRQWMSRWGSCSEPGPIDGYDIFCKHGGIRPALVHAVKDFVFEVPSAAWHRLVDAHGGGPAVTKLVKCVVCETDAEQLARRRQYEGARISELDRTDGRGGWYIISAQWLNEWHSFKNSKDPNHRPPGPVRNTDMLQPDGQPKPKMKAAVHYRGVGKEVWDFFIQVYGGGPCIHRTNIDIYLPPLPDSER